MRVSKKKIITGLENTSDDVKNEIAASVVTAEAIDMEDPETESDDE